MHETCLTFEEIKALKPDTIVLYEEDGQMMRCRVLGVGISGADNDWLGVALEITETVNHNGFYVDGVPGTTFEAGHSIKYWGMYQSWRLMRDGHVEMTPRGLKITAAPTVS